MCCPRAIRACAVSQLGKLQVMQVSCWQVYGKGRSFQLQGRTMWVAGKKNPVTKKRGQRKKKSTRSGTTNVNGSDVGTKSKAGSTKRKGLSGTTSKEETAARSKGGTTKDASKTVKRGGRTTPRRRSTSRSRVDENEAEGEQHGKLEDTETARIGRKTATRKRGRNSSSKNKNEMEASSPPTELTLGEKPKTDTTITLRRSKRLRSM